MAKRSLKNKGYISVTIETRKAKIGKRYALRWFDPNSHKREFRPVGTDMQLAKMKRREYEIRLNSKLLNIHIPGEATKQNVTFNEFWEIYVKAEEGTKRGQTMLTYKYCLQAFQRAFPEVVYLRDVSSYDCQCYVSERLQEVASATLNKELRHTKALFSKAQAWGYIEENPFLNIKRVKEGDSEVNTITMAQEELLLKTVDRDPLLKESTKLKYKSIIRIAVQGGLRNSEIRFLRWKDINLTTGEISITNREDWTTKSGKNRIVYVNEDSLLYLGKLKLVTKGKPDDQPFHYWGHRNLSHQFKKLTDRAGIKCTLHDLRRTCASRLAEAGINPQVHMEYLGHSDIKTTMRYYTKISKSVLQEAMQKAVGKAETLTGIGSSFNVA